MKEADAPPPWYARAACARADLAGQARMTSSIADVARAEAQNWCPGCPVTQKCIAHALTLDVAEGIYGGYYIKWPEDRAKAKRRRRRLTDKEGDPPWNYGEMSQVAQGRGGT